MLRTLLSPTIPLLLLAVIISAGIFIVYFAKKNLDSETQKDIADGIGTLYQKTEQLTNHIGESYEEYEQIITDLETKKKQKQLKKLKKKMKKQNFLERDN